MKRENGKRRRRRGAREWSELMEAQARSGASQRAFCEAHQVSLSTFVRSLSRHRTAPDDGTTRQLPAQFVPVTLDSTPGGLWELELQLGSFVEVRMRGR